jgi:hypothetical protein
MNLGVLALSGRCKVALTVPRVVLLGVIVVQTTSINKQMIALLFVDIKDTNCLYVH